MSRRPGDIETDMRRLRRMLDRVRMRSGTNRRVDPSGHAGEPTRILDVACGACDEAETLADYFADLKSGQSDGDVELVGIDVRAREIADAQRRVRDAARRAAGGITPAPKFEFLNGDATRLDDHRELGEAFDVVFFRHQNLWNGRRTWTEIFDKALHKLEDDGELIITSYFDREHRLAIEAIQALGGELIASERNAESRELPTPGKSIDRHVAVFRKRNP